MSGRSFYLMNFSQVPLRGAEIWHIWKQHHVIECFWKIMKSIFQMRSMQLQGDGLYTQNRHLVGLIHHIRQLYAQLQVSL